MGTERRDPHHVQDAETVCAEPRSKPAGPPSGQSLAAHARRPSSQRLGSPSHCDQAAFFSIWCGSITNFFGAPASNSAYPCGELSSEITCTPTASAILMRSQRMARISARLYFITDVWQVKKLCD